MAVSSQLRAEVDRLIGAFAEWARGRADVRALAVVGSWARDAAGTASDLDFVVLADEPSRYLEDWDWAAAFEGAEPAAARTWGELTERRLRMPSGLEIDVGFATPSWAALPLDPGTARVVRDGLVPLHDPDGLLKAAKTGKTV